MANYTFYDPDLDREFDISMPISELDDYKAKNPHLRQVIKTLNVADPTRLGLKKPDSGFRDVLDKVKRAHPRGNVNTW